MERYSKVYGSKWQSQYSEELKLKVCQEYLDGQAGLRELEQKYKLGNSRISAWLKSFGLEKKRPVYVSSYIMPAKKEPDIQPEDSALAAASVLACGPRSGLQHDDPLA